MRVGQTQRWSIVSIMLILSLVLAACGGGGGGTETSPSPATGGTTASPSPADEGTEASPSPADEGTEASPSPADEGTAASPSPDDEAAATPDAGATPEAGTTPVAGGTAASECPADVQGGQVTMWSPLTGGDGDEMTRLAQQFSEENPNGITVQHVPQPEYLQKLNTAAAGGNLPDMSVIRSGDIAEMAERNIVQPMSDEVLNIIGGEGLAQDFPEDVWQIAEYNGERYGIPLDVIVQVLYYNTQMFEEAGIEMPTDRPMTREEFEAAAEQLTQNGVAGVAIGTLYSAETFFHTLILQFGGDLANEEGTEAAYNSEAGVRALEYIQQLKQQYTPNISGQGDPEVTQFQQGRAAMVMHGPWWISGLQELPFTGFAMIPQFGDEYALPAGSHHLSLTTDDPARQAAAACWIGWLSENSVQWAAAGQIPARTSQREDPAIEEINPAVAAFAPSAEAARFLPQVPGLGAAVGPEGIGRAVNPVLLGQQTDIQAALDQAAQRSNQLIEQNAQQYGGGQ